MEEITICSSLYSQYLEQCFLYTSHQYLLNQQIVWWLDSVENQDFHLVALPFQHTVSNSLCKIATLDLTITSRLQSGKRRKKKVKDTFPKTICWTAKQRGQGLLPYIYRFLQHLAEAEEEDLRSRVARTAAFQISRKVRSNHEVGIPGSRWKC